MEMVEPLPPLRRNWLEDGEEGKTMGLALMVEMLSQET